MDVRIRVRATLLFSQETGSEFDPFQESSQTNHFGVTRLWP